MMDSACKKQLLSFFDGKYEKSLEDDILNDSFLKQKVDVFKYIEKINNIPICSFVEYIQTYCKRQPIMAADVFQFSDFDDATINICESLNRINNPGVKFKDVAKLLLTDNVIRNDVALSKYGENHIKTAESIGLAFKDDSKNYYLSAIGCVFNDLSEEAQKKLLLRLIIRNKLITQLFVAAMQGSFDLEAFLYDLSKSTYLRRRTNINRIIELLNDTNEYDFSKLTKNIVY